MSEPARDHIVSPDPIAPAALAPTAIEAPPRDRRPLWIGILLGVAIAVLMVLLVQQTRRADGLEADVGRLSGELQASQRTVAAYKGHLGEVRGQVGTLSSQMQALRDLVEADPEAAQAPRHRPAGLEEMP